MCFLEVEPETQVRVHVPVRTQGEDVSPGVKRGGFVQILRNTVPVRCRSDSIPKNFMMDVSALDVGKIIKNPRRRGAGRRDAARFRLGLAHDKD